MQQQIISIMTNRTCFFLFRLTSKVGGQQDWFLSETVILVSVEKSKQLEKQV